AHVPQEVSVRYPEVDQDVLRECRILVLAMVAAWRLDPGDQLPDGQRAARQLLSALREGPPWPALDVVMR
ncbi:MAG TPA: aminoglycoside phosphotransferase family protein, partial [Actinomycetota bacterium]|nr:aminoglycoside phosphotransferase family protein [Actinomycetota bacterium]